MPILPVILLLAGAAAALPDTPVVTMQEVVVIGTRVPETFLRTPAAVSVVHKSQFADTRGISLKDALNSVPGVFIQSRSGGQDVRVTIRGFGARGNGERSNSGNIRGIRILTDGIPVTEPDGRTSLDLVDLGSISVIEVARSNVSALYGNASGGAVNLRTNFDFEAPYVQLRERLGSFGYHREQGLAGLTLENGGRATISVLNSTFDGWRKHSESSITAAQFRLSTPLDGSTRLGVFLDGTSDLNRFPGPLTAAQADSAPRQANPIFVQRNDRRKNKVGRVSLTLDRGIDSARDLGLTFFLEPKVLERSERNRFRDFNRYHVGGSGTYEWRTTFAQGIESRLSLGADEAWQDGAILFYDLGPGGGRGEQLIANQREGANSAGGFVQEEISWDERWSVRLCARYDALWYLAEDRIAPELNDDRSLNRVTPKVALSYHVADHTVYTALGGGVEVPAFNEIDPPAPFDTLTALNPFLDAMHSVTYELGARGEIRSAARVLPGRLRYDAALYWIDVRNDIVPFDGGAFFFTAGKSRRKGIELGLEWLPIEQLRVQSALTLSENRYRDYQNELGDFSGNEISGLPEAVATATARYVMPLGLSAEIGVESVDGYFADDANTARTEPYTLLDATLGYTRSFGARSLRVYVGGHNLTDERYSASVFLNGLNQQFFEPGLPRNWSGGLTLGLR